MKYLIVWALISIQLCYSYAQRNKLNEHEYSEYIQSLIGGQREFTVYNGRVDLVTETYAFEIERAYNWKEAIGQCLWYAIQTKLKPGIILIRESPEEFKYFQMLNSTLEYSGLSESIEVLLFPDDFKVLIDGKAKEK